MHICISKLTIIGSNNGLTLNRQQAIIWTNYEILLIGPLGTNFSGILIEIYTFSLKKMHLIMSSGKWRPSCLGLNVFMVSLNLKVHHSKATPFLPSNLPSKPNQRLQTDWLQDKILQKYINGLVQDCSNSIANALELPQSCTKPSTYCMLLPKISDTNRIRCKNEEHIHFVRKYSPYAVWYRHLESHKMKIFSEMHVCISVIWSIIPKCKK